MKKTLCFLLILFYYGCGTKPSANKPYAEKTVDTTPITKSDTAISANHAAKEVDTTDSEHAIFYVVIADTSLHYYALHASMFRLSELMHLQIDTMGRYFDNTKNLIALPEDDEDEIFAGDYFPRRFPSGTLSLEYVSLYKPMARPKTIALVTGIFEAEASADSMLSVLKAIEPKSFKIETNMYIGCIH